MSTTTTTTTDAPAAHGLRPEQPVMITLDPRRPARQGVYVEDGDKAGTVRVRYEIQGKGERFSEVRTDRVVAVHEAPTDAELVAAVHRGIEAGTLIEVNDEFLAKMAAEIAEDEQAEVDEPAAEAPAQVVVGTHAKVIEDADEQGHVTGVDAHTLQAMDKAGHLAAHDAEAGTGTLSSGAMALRARLRGVDTPAEAPKAAKAPKRAPLRDGYVTPTGLVKAINERGLYRGNAGELRVQALYSYLRNAPAGHPSPFGDVDGRYSAPLETAVQWWVEKDARVAAKATERAGRPVKGSTELRAARVAQRAAQRLAERARAAQEKTDAALQAAQERAQAATEAANAAQRSADEAAAKVAELEASQAATE